MIIRILLSATLSMENAFVRDVAAAQPESLRQEVSEPLPCCQSDLIFLFRLLNLSVV